MAVIPQDMIKEMARQERDMDSGKQAYVLLAGNRIAVSPEEMEAFGLKSGQTINTAIAQAISMSFMDNLKAQLIELIAEKAIKKAE